MKANKIEKGLVTAVAIMDIVDKNGLELLQ